jgi:hypothetical protein
VFGDLLDDFLAHAGRVEADFTMRWNAALLGAPKGVRRQAPQSEWRPYA